MNKDVKSAYPGTPDSFHHALENTCKEIEQMNATGRKHMRSTTMLVAALIAVLMLAGLAFAAVQSRLLEDLFFNRAPNQEAQQLLEPIGQSVTQEGITLTLGDYLVDGDEWYLSYSVESQRDEPVLLSAAWRYLSYNERLTDGEGWGLQVLGGSVGGVSMPGVYTGMYEYDPQGYGAPAPADQPFELTLLVRVAKPKMELVMWPPEGLKINDYSDISEGEWARYKENKQLPVYGWGLTEFPKYIADIDRASEVGVMRVCEDAGTVEPLTELRLSVTIDPTKGSNVAHARLLKPERFVFDDYALEVDLVDLTPTKSDVRFRVLPDQWQNESGLTKEAYIAKFSRDYALLNADGENLNGQDAGSLFNAYEQILLERKYVPYSASGSLSELPDVLVLVPVVWGEGEWPERRIEGYDMEHAVTLKLGKSVPTFTVRAQTLPDVGPVMERFFGADAQKLEPTKPALELSGGISYASSDREYVVDWYQKDGFFYMSKPSVSATGGIPGKYTEAEAVEIAKQFLSDEIGIDKTLLLVGDVYPEDLRDARAHAYQIMFSYSYDGMVLKTQGFAGVSIDVTDGGVVHATGNALRIVRDEP